MATVDLGAGDAPIKKSKACVPCHERKVGCNATRVGLPCTRCVKRNETQCCAWLTSPEKDARYGKRKSTHEQVDHRSFNETAPSRSASTTALLNVPVPTRATNCPGVQEQVAQRSPGSYVLLSPTHPTPAAEHSAYQHSSTDNPERVDVLSQQEPFLAVRDEDMHLQMCRDMSQWGSATSLHTFVGHLDRGRELVEYHDGTNSITILGEVFGQGQKHPRRLVRILLKNPDLPHAEHGELSGLDDADTEYLHRKGALHLPPRGTCDKLLRLYFECVDPYGPVLDRSHFLEAYQTGQCSLFLLQSMFANVVPYASSDLLREAGFPDRVEAQQTFYSRAKLLYDLGCEKRQLQLLQGSFVLSSSTFPFSVDKDYRFWLTNAVRIAVQMGLHRNSTASEIDDRTKRLFRRIWWVLHNRDMCLVAFGVDNVRRLRDTDFDTAPLGESDWDEEAEGVPPKFNHIVRPVTQLEKVYLIENCKLAQITGQYMQVLKAPNLGVPPELVLQGLEKSLSVWRTSLPPELRLENIREWTSGRIWVLVLMAMSYHLECIFYRTLRERSRGRATTDILTDLWAQKQQHAMFELDTIIRRIVLAKVAQFCPLSVPTCATTVVAMYIETALDPSISSNERLMARVNLHAGLFYLRETAEYWRGIEWPLRMFEVIVARTSLTVNSQANVAEFNVRSMNPFDSDVDHPLTKSDKVDGHELPTGGNHFDVLKNSEDWLQDFFNSNFIDLHDDLAFNAG